MSLKSDFEENTGIPIKLVAIVVVCIIAGIAAFAGLSSITSTVDKGTYQIKQAAVVGTMSAHMEPGMYMRLWGDVAEWPRAETFYFTHDEEGDDVNDQSIEVRFNDGSLCNISGTLRVTMPTTDKEAISLVKDDGFQAYRDVEQKLILPTVRNALRLTANLMSARESYSEKRPDFNFFAWDQIQNGIYETVEETKEVTDTVTGEKVTKTFKRIKKDKDGNTIYQHNPLDGKGIRLANFEIKSFQYAPEVKKQISAQQKAYMAIATAKAEAQQAEQSRLKEIAEGKSRVAKAEYQQEEQKIKAVVEAQKEKEVAILSAEKEKETAKLKKEAAGFYKQEQVLRGQGDAAYKKAVMTADGALKQKLETFERVQQMWANAYATRKVPHAIVASGGANGDQDAAMTGFQQLMTTMALQNLGLDMKIQK